MAETNNTRKVQVELPEESIEAIKAIAYQRKISVAEAFRQAIASEALLQRELNSNSEIVVNKTDGTRTRLVLEP